MYTRVDIYNSLSLNAVHTLACAWDSYSSIYSLIRKRKTKIFQEQKSTSTHTHTLVHSEIKESDRNGERERETERSKKEESERSRARNELKIDAIHETHNDVTLYT